MKRHPALEPFSRDHNDGLILARSLQSAKPASVDAARDAWTDELRDHFDEEERLLVPVCEHEMADRLFRDHAEIARRIAALPSDPSGLGDALERHIRWEERELFPNIERTASAAQLAHIAHESAILEERRWPTDARRARLVRRRRAAV